MSGIWNGERWRRMAGVGRVWPLVNVAEWWSVAVGRASTRSVVVPEEVSIPPLATIQSESYLREAQRTNRPISVRQVWYPPRSRTSSTQEFGGNGKRTRAVRLQTVIAQTDSPTALTALRGSTFLSRSRGNAQLSRVVQQNKKHFYRWDCAGGPVPHLVRIHSSIRRR